jgi:hypothetical protein
MNQKWNLQDIRPVQSSKRRIGVSTPDLLVRTKGETNEDVATEVHVEEEPAPHIHIQNGNKQKSKSLILGLIVFFCVLGGGLFASALMGGAEVTVYPRYKEPTINALFTAEKEPQGDALAYEVMTLEADGERQVKASGEEVIKEQATGSIFIYNEAQKEPLRLKTNTRFETAEGLIFKIKDSVVVPGYRTETNGAKIRGVITAEVYADEVGEAYNVTPTKFTVPGFKGEPEYTTVYAESTETFKGGYNGKKFVIDEAELQTAQQALRTELRNSLLNRVESEQPAGFTVFKDAVTFTYESLPSVAYGDNLATVKEKVYLRIPTFKKDDFASFVAKAGVPGYTNEGVRLEDPHVLTFSYKVATTSGIDISTLAHIDFKLEGKPRIIWTYDSEKLKADLLNANKTALNVVLSGFPAIEKATAVVRPFWKTKFPTDIKKVKIIEIVGQQ